MTQEINEEYYKHNTQTIDKLKIIPVTEMFSQQEYNLREFIKNPTSPTTENSDYSKFLVIQNGENYYLLQLAYIKQTQNNSAIKKYIDLYKIFGLRGFLPANLGLKILDITTDKTEDLDFTKIPQQDKIFKLTKVENGNTRTINGNPSPQYKLEHLDISDIPIPVSENSISTKSKPKTPTPTQTRTRKTVRRIAQP